METRHQEGQEMAVSRGVARWLAEVAGEEESLLGTTRLLFMKTMPFVFSVSDDLGTYARFCTEDPSKAMWVGLGG